MKDCMDWLSEAAVLSTLNANSGYSQVESENDDREKTASTSHHFYRFLRMSIALQISQSAFQQAMSSALSAARGLFPLLYLVDSVVFSWTAAEHIAHVQHVSSVVCDAETTIKLNICSLATKKIN